MKVKFSFVTLGNIAFFVDESLMDAVAIHFWFNLASYSERTCIKHSLYAECA